MPEVVPYEPPVRSVAEEEQVVPAGASKAVFVPCVQAKVYGDYQQGATGVLAVRVMVLALTVAVT